MIDTYLDPLAPVAPYLPRRRSIWPSMTNSPKKWLDGSEVDRQYLSRFN